MLERLGNNIGEFSARQLTPETVDSADLVLTMTREHRSVVVEMAPQLLNRTFTLRQFGRMVKAVLDGSAPSWEPDPAERWRQLVKAASSVRHEALAAVPEDDDVVDPYGASEQIHLQMGDEVTNALRSFIEFESEVQRNAKAYTHC